MNMLVQEVSLLIGQNDRLIIYVSAVEFSNLISQRLLNNFQICYGFYSTN